MQYYREGEEAFVIRLVILFEYLSIYAQLQPIHIKTQEHRLEDN